MGFNGEAREDVSEVKGKIYKRTDISYTRLRQKMRIEVDALDYATGEVLSIECEDRR